MPHIRVRAAEPEDAAAQAEIMNCPGVIRGTLQLPYRSDAERFERFDTLRPEIRMLVAEIDGRVIGNLGLNLNPTRWRRRHAASLGMAVHDDFQGQGVGTALVEAAIDLAENWLGITRIELEVYCDNEPAVRLYQKCGFEIEGTLRRFAFRDGEYVDVYAMARLKP